PMAEPRHLPELTGRVYRDAAPVSRDRDRARGRRARECRSNRGPLGAARGGLRLGAGWHHYRRQDGPGAAARTTYYRANPLQLAARAYESVGENSVTDLAATPRRPRLLCTSGNQMSQPNKTRP